MTEVSGFPPLEPKERRKRKRERAVIVAALLIIALLFVAEYRMLRSSSSLPFVNSIFFFGLLNVNVILLIVLVWLVFRNIGKLFLERRRRVLGARLKTKLVLAFLGFSIIPTLVLFVISSMYINSSFDKWFSLKIQNTLQASLDITHTFYRNADRTAMHFATHLAGSIGKQLKTDPGVQGDPYPAWMKEFLDAQRTLLALDAVEYYSDPLEERVIAEGTARERVKDGEGEAVALYPRLSLDVLEEAFGGKEVSTVEHVGTGDIIRCLVPVKSGSAVHGVVAVDTYIPVSLVNKADEIAFVIDDYKETNPLKYPLKTTYFVILVLITLVIIFVAIWIGFYLARELTVPVERLVYGARAVGAGNLDVTIAGSGHDEIAVLVDSFNRMTRDLRDNRERLTQATGDLEKRRLQLEAVLANVGTGVIAVDSGGEVTTFNHAVSQLLRLKPEEVVGKHYREALSERLGDEVEPIVETIDLALKGVSAEPRQWSLQREGEARVLSATGTSLRGGLETRGAVVVIDDMTTLVKGQREMAWREVARRIAHEIKNPLTPIKLSAQRLQRRLSAFRGKESALVQECTETIIRHTDELKEMVNEFSNFARLPEINPSPNQLNEVLGEVVSLYAQAHPELEFVIETESKLPTFSFDRDQIKRVFINLFDNAVGVLAGSGKRPVVRAATHYNDQLQIAVVTVRDNGPGMSDDVKTRVFEPYFSTKKEGTGLGLAIAKRIVNDHDGFIRVHSTPGEGTEFLIELPTALRQFSEKRATPGGLTHA